MHYHTTIIQLHYYANTLRKCYYYSLRCSVGGGPKNISFEISPCVQDHIVRLYTKFEKFEVAVTSGDRAKGGQKKSVDTILATFGDLGFSASITAEAETLTSFSSVH